MEVVRNYLKESSEPEIRNESDQTEETAAMHSKEELQDNCTTMSPLETEINTIKEDVDSLNNRVTFIENQSTQGINNSVTTSDAYKPPPNSSEKFIVTDFM